MIVEACDPGGREGGREGGENEGEREEVRPRKTFTGIKDRKTCS
jgi:hypothetical protein